MVKNGNKRQRTSQNAIKLTGHTVNKTLKDRCPVRDTLRRSVTIEKPLHNYIIEVRGWLGLQKHIDVDYTTILNMLAKLGIDVFANIFSNYDRLSKEQKQIISETLEGDYNQKIEAIQDELWNQKLRANIPEYNLEEEDKQQEANLGEEESNNSNSVKGKKSEDIHEPV